MTRRYYLCDEINNETVAPAIEWLLELNDHLEPADIRSVPPATLVINSPGGDGVVAFGLIDLMLSSIVPIDTVVAGEGSSAGFMIFLAGRKRSMTDNSVLMSHQPYNEFEGHPFQIEISIGEFKKINNRILRYYTQRLPQLPARRIKRLLLGSTDCWIDKQQAIQLGMCNCVDPLFPIVHST